MRRVLLVGVLVLVAAAGCSTTGRVDGPVFTTPNARLQGGYGDALVGGRLILDAATGCLLLGGEPDRYPVVWPAGASWWVDPPRVRLRSGVFVEIGMSVSGGGGFFQRDFVERFAGPEVADAAAACAGPTGEIAVFNPGSRVTVTDETPG
jgi:hypothetical protein